MRRFEARVMYLTWRQKREAEKARTASENQIATDRSAENLTATGENVVRMPEKVTTEAEPVKVINRYLESLSPGSRRTMRQSLTVIASILRAGTSPENVEWHKLTAENVRKVKAVLAVRYQPATANKMLSALRGVLRVCHQMGLMNQERYRAAVSIPNLGTEPESLV